MINRKKFLFISIFLLAVFFIICIFMVVYNNVNHSIATNAAASGNLPLIIIDAGHGGADGGAVAADGTVEKGINLEIARKLKNLFDIMGYKTLMTRTDDNSIHSSDAVSTRQKKVSDIHNRMKIVDEHPNSVFISIHQNKFPGTKYYGTQVFYSPNTSSSVDLAKSIQDSVKNLLQNENERQIKKSGTEIYLLYHAKSTAVMVECGFMSNVPELERLKNAEYQQKMAFSIFCGTNDYLTTQEK